MVTMYQPILVGNYFQHLEHCLLKLSMIFYISQWKPLLCVYDIGKE